MISLGEGKRADPLIFVFMWCDNDILLRYNVLFLILSGSVLYPLSKEHSTTPEKQSPSLYRLGI
jgi:hypothetical protein